MSTSPDFRDKAVFLFGPTAVGKTRLLFDFFSETGEVVNADSVQVYRGLDIGSAKAGREITDRIAHHLIDILDPWESYNVADFIRLGDQACSGIWDRGKVPVISGGTAFYFKHFMYGLSAAPQSDPEIRRSVDLLIRDQGLAFAHSYLEIVDPVSAGRINPNDAYRVSRAIEVYRQTGRPLSSFALPTTPRNDMKILSIGLMRDRDELRRRIRQRVDIMFESGIVNEIRTLLENGASPAWQSMGGIGYHEFMDKIYKDNSSESVKALDGLTSSEIADIKEHICMNSIHYAKRQMTFFGSFKDVHWINPDDTESLTSAISTFMN